MNLSDEPVDVVGVAGGKIVLPMVGLLDVPEMVPVTISAEAGL